jgi:hypothetical protein
VHPAHRFIALAATIAAVALASAAQAAQPGLFISSYELGRVDQGLSTGAKEITMLVHWPSSQPDKPNQLDKAYMDALTAAVLRINNAGRGVHLIFAGSPPWANGGHSDDLNYAPTPDHDQDFADWIASVVKEIKQAGGKVDRIQPWNEPDDPQYWKPQPSDVNRYASMLSKTYDAVKDPAKGDPRVQVMTAATAGNDYRWLEQLFPLAPGKFDAVAVDNTNSCATAGPDSVYREADGRLGRFTYMGFLEVLKVMDAHGLQNMPLIFASSAWSSTNGGPTSCTRGSFAGLKPDGVSEDEQARLMKVAFSCMANYARIPVIEWFRLEDTSDDPLNEFNHYGLFRVDGSPKPSLQAFKDLVASNGGSPGFCADLTPATVQIVQPVAGQKFDDRLDFQVKASDADGVGLARLSLYSPLSTNSIRNFTGTVNNDQVYGMTPWFGSRDLPLGKHTLRVDALDTNGNVASATVEVEKVKAGSLKGTRTVRYATPKKPLSKSCTQKARKRTCTVNFGTVQGVQPGPTISGKVNVEWQWRNKKRKWRKLVGGTKPANKPLVFTATLPQRGNWRVRAVFEGSGEYKSGSSRYYTFTAR